MRGFAERSKIIQVVYTKAYKRWNDTCKRKTCKSNYKIKQNDEILARIPEPQVLDVVAEDIDVPILYEDEHIIVVDKPKGMVVASGCGKLFRHFGKCPA